MKRKTGGRALALGCALMILWGAGLEAREGERADLYEGGEKAQRLVVRLTAPTTEGAGVIFHVDQHYAYGITAKHVIYQQGKLVKGVQVQFRAWPGEQFPVDGFKFHLTEDLAAFRADLRSLGLSLAELQRGIPLDQRGRSLELDPGAKLASIGHSTAGAWVSPKKQIQFARDDGNAFLFEYECPQGHSGGAVFDDQWRLVGMMIDEERPYCRALRIEPILEIIQGWKLDISLSMPASLQKIDQPANREITVAVVDFDNRSAKALPNLGYVAQDITTSYLSTLPGVTLVSRDRLSSVRREIKLPDTVQSAQGISHAGKLLQADALVTGSIVRYDVERRTFTGFGTSALQDIFRMSISLQILDVKTAKVQFSETFDVERVKQYPKETSAPGQPIDLTSELLKALLDEAQSKIRSALTQVAAGLGRTDKLIAVPVRSTPAGADILVNGLYVGKTPTEIKLTPDGTHEIEIVLAGHTSWKRRFNAQPGKSIEATLGPRR